MPKSRANKARERAGNADVMVSISGLPRELNVPEKERISSTTVLKGITKDGSVSSYVALSPFYEGAKNAWNKYEAALLARSIDLAINELMWKALVKAKVIDAHATRLLALELVRAQRNWEFASKIEENHVSHNVSEAALTQRPYMQHKLEKQLALQYRTMRRSAVLPRSISILNFLFPFTFESCQLN